MKRSRNKTETEDEWLEAIFAKTPAGAALRQPADGKTVLDEVIPISPLTPFWQRTDLHTDPGEINFDTIDTDFPGLAEALDEALAEIRKRTREETAAKSRVVEKMEGPYPAPGPVWSLDWSRFEPEAIVLFWVGKIAHLSRHADVHSIVPGSLNRAEIVALLLMRNVENDEIKNLGFTQNMIERGARIIREAVMTGMLPSERVPDGVKNARSIASKKVQRDRKETRGSRWLNADGSYREPRKRDEEEEIPEEGDEDYDT